MTGFKRFQKIPWGIADESLDNTDVLRGTVSGINPRVIIYEIPWRIVRESKRFTPRYDREDDVG